MNQAKNILLGGFESEFLRSTGWEDESPELTRRLEESTRLGILFSAERALVPAPGYFETGAGYRVMQRFKPSQERGQLVLTGTGPGPYAFICSKLDHWRGRPRELALYEQAGPQRASRLDGRAWQAKRAPTDPLVIASWQKALATGTHPLIGPLRRARRAARTVTAIPERLEGKAIILENVVDQLPRGVELRGTESHLLRLHLGNGFLASYLGDTEAIGMIDSSVHMSQALFPQGAVTVRDTQLRRVLTALGMERIMLEEASPELVAEVADSEIWRCLRHELTAGPVESVGMFARRELKALSKAGERCRIKSRLDLAGIEDSLDRQHEALERTVERGARPNLRLLSGLGNGALTAMGAQRSFAGAQFLGSRLEEGRRLSALRLEQELLGILTSASSSELEERVGALDSLLSQQDESSSPSEIAALISERERLAEQLGKLAPSLKAAIFSIATGALGSVVAQGLFIAVKALGG
jgi:hypothetical protein